MTTSESKQPRDHRRYLPSWRTVLMLGVCTLLLAALNHYWLVDLTIAGLDLNETGGRAPVTTVVILLVEAFFLLILFTVFEKWARGNKPSVFQFILGTILCLVLFLGLGLGHSLGVRSRWHAALERQRFIATVQQGLVAVDGSDTSTSLSLADKEFSHKAWRCLQDFPALSRIDLNGTNIADEDLRHLSTLRNLEFVDLSHTQISDDGLAYLANLDRLVHVDLSGTEVTGAGFKYLIDLPNLERVALMGHTISSAGLEYLGKMPQLECLDLRASDISDNGLKHFEALVNLESLSLPHTPVTDAGLDHLKNLTRLEFLDLGNTRISDHGLVRLKRMKKLKYLDLCGAGITDRGLLHLKELSALERLELRCASVIGSGLEHLGHLPKLRSLSLEGPQITDSTLESVMLLPHLESLHLSNTRVSQAGFDKLQQAMPKANITRTVTIPVPDRPGFSPFEPHIAVDSENPERLLVGAMFVGRVRKGDNVRWDSRLLAWQSEDGGRSWSKPITPFRYSEPPLGRHGADPVVAFGTGKTCWFSGLDQMKPNYSSVKVSLSEDGGTTWEAPITVSEVDNDKQGKGFIDKPWLAVDTSGGKHRGTLYVAWCRADDDRGHCELRCAALPPGSRQFAPGVRLGEPASSKAQVGSDLMYQVQLAVRPDGTLDAVWRVAPSSRLAYASSQDGGATFTRPELISEDEEGGVGQFPYPSLTATPDGELLVAWTTVGGNVLCSVLTSGRWSTPRPVAGDRLEGARLSLPAGAATAGSLWVLAYRTESQPRRVCVVLYRSTDDGKSWKEHQVIASRMLAEFSPGVCVGLAGDYVGLAAARGTVYAAYVLPGEDRKGAKPQLYVSVLGTSKER